MRKPCATSAEEELSGQNVGRGELYLAGALVALGQVDEGKERLRTIYGRTVTNGQCRAWFAKLSAFDAIREDEDIVDLVVEWEEAEKVAVTR
jgi:hypothetical protein